MIKIIKIYVGVIVLLIIALVFAPIIKKNDYIWEVYEEFLKWYMGTLIPIVLTSLVAIYTVLFVMATIL